MKFVAEIDIMPHKELLDPQGKTALNNLKHLHLTGVSDLRIGRHVSMSLEASSEAEAREKVEMLAKDLGFTLAELAGLGEPKRKRSPSTKTFRHPENPTLTWSGRGRKPGWFAAHVDAGKDPDVLLG